MDLTTPNCNSARRLPYWATPEAPLRPSPLPSPFPVGLRVPSRPRCSRARGGFAPFCPLGPSLPQEGQPGERGDASERARTAAPPRAGSPGGKARRARPEPPERGGQELGEGGARGLGLGGVGKAPRGCLGYRCSFQRARASRITSAVPFLRRTSAAVRATRTSRCTRSANRCPHLTGRIPCRRSKSRTNSLPEFTLLAVTVRAGVGRRIFARRRNDVAHSDGTKPSSPG